MTKLPVTPAGSWFEFSIELDSVTYGFNFRWNEREGVWYVTLLDAVGNSLVSGRKVVLGGLFKAYRSNPGVMQTGDVYVVDMDDGDSDPGLVELGDSVQLFYATDAELG